MRSLNALFKASTVLTVIFMSLIFLFANDILLFPKTYIDQLKNLNFLILAFKHATGLKISLQKSIISSINVDQPLIDEVISIWGYCYKALPTEYLGMPSGGNPRHTTFWNPIIKEIEKKN